MSLKRLPEFCVSKRNFLKHKLLLKMKITEMKGNSSSKFSSRVAYMAESQHQDQDLLPGL